MNHDPSPFPITAWLRYSIPVASVSIALLARIYLISWVEGRFPLLLFILPVLVSVWYGGLGPGIVAIFLSILASICFTPPYNLDITSASGQERLILFLIVSMTVTVIIAQLQAARKRMEEKDRQLEQEIIERQQIEQDLRHQAELQVKMEALLKEALEKAETANTAKSEFLAHISHEIRTPMNAVIGIGNILATCTLPPEKQQEMVHTLQLSAQSLMALIDDLLDIAKIENGQIELENAPFNLKTLVEDMVHILSVKAHEKRIALTLDYDAQLGRGFIGDAHRIRQLLMNLVGNAVKFTEKGGVSIVVAASLNEATFNNDVHITVRDTGIGIAPEKLDSIFGKFSQADSSITRRYGGTGLGLAISKMLAELMSGTIKVESKPGQGSSFILALPLLGMAEQQFEPVRKLQASR